jgi:predicted ATPase
MINAVVGREKEQSELKETIDKASAGAGSTTLISGKPGIGKTVLGESIAADYAAKPDYQVFTGKCLPETSVPFQPFVKILKSAGLEHLLSPESPKIETVSIVYKDGRCIETAQSQDSSSPDPELVSGMLQAIRDFARESYGKGDLSQLKFRDLDLVIEQGKNCYVVAAIKNGISKSLCEDVKNIVTELEKQNPKLEMWDGNKDGLVNLSAPLAGLVEKYKGEFNSSNLKNEKDKIIDRVTEGLKTKAIEKPILVYIDDMHLADPSTLQLFHYLSRNIRDSKIAILGTFSPQESSTLSDTLANMSRENLYQEVNLKTLTLENVRTIVSEKYGLKLELIEEFAKQLYSKTEGDPLYVIETLRLLEQQNIIKQGQDWLANINLEKISIPNSIKDIIQQRLSGLDAATHKTLKYAAAFGQEINPKILRKALKLDDETLGEHLERLLQTNILNRKNGNYIFDQTSVRNVVYSSLEPASKRALHLSIAKAIEGLYQKNLPEQFATLAWHYTNIANALEQPIDLEEDLPILQKAVRFNSEAGRQTKQKYAHEESAKLFEHSLKFLETLESNLSGEQKLDNQKQKLSVLDELQQLNYVAGKWAESAEFNKKLITLAQNLGDERKVAEGHKNIGEILMQKSDWTSAIANLEQAIEISEKINLNELSVDSHCVLGRIYMLQGMFEKSTSNYSKALELAQNLGDRRRIALTQDGAGTVYHETGQYDTSLEFFQNAAKGFEEIGDLTNLSLAYHHICAAYASKDQYEKTVEFAQKEFDIMQKIGDVAGTARSLLALGCCASLGDYEKSARYLNQAEKLFQKINSERGLSLVYMNLGIAYGFMKNWSASESYFNQSLELKRKLNLPVEEAWTYEEMATMYKSKGEDTARKNCASKAIELYKQHKAENRISEKLIELAN